MKKENGSVLIVSLWALIFFSAITVILAARVQSQIGAVKRISGGFESGVAAASGVSLVLDYFEKWSQAPKGAATAQPLDPSFFSDNPKFFQNETFSVGRWTADGKFIYGLSDEETKININAAPLEVLTRLYTSPEIGEGNSAAAMAAATIEWRSRKKEFLEFGHKLGEKGAYFGSVEELLLVPGMPEAFWNRAKDSLTVYGNGFVNLNTAPKETLVLLGLSENLAARIVETRENFMKTQDPSAVKKAYENLGDLTQKVGVSSEENAQLSNVAKIWGFESTTFRFWAYGVKDVKETDRPRGIECVADEKGRVLFFRDL